MNRKNDLLFAGIVLLILGFCLIIWHKNDDGITTHQSEDTSITIIDITTSKSYSNAVLYAGLGTLLLGLGLIGWHFLKHSRKSGFQKLTNQESTVVNAIERGLNNKEIASELHISLSTVKTHVSNVYRKMGVNSRNELLELIRKSKD